MESDVDVDEEERGRKLEADLAATGALYDEKLLGNTHTKEVHDLDLETENCQIDEIIKAGHVVAFDTLPDAHAADYDNCAFCLGNSER
jgi:hypothetical protein